MNNKDKTSTSDHPLGLPAEPAKSQNKMLWGLIGLIILMFVMISLIVWQLSSSEHVDNNVPNAINRL